MSQEKPGDARPVAPSLAASTVDVTGLGSVRTRQVRLLVSVPALMLLTTVGLGLLMSFQLDSIDFRGNASDVQKQVDDARDVVHWVTAGVAIVAAGVGALLAFQIVRPIRALISSMSEVARGDLTAKAAVPQLGELGSLGHTFNVMVEQLHSLFEERNRQMREAAEGTRIMLDPDGVITGIDSATRRFLGWGQAEVIGRRLVDLLDASDRNLPFREAVAECLGSGSTNLTAGPTGFWRPGESEPVLYSISCSRLQSANPVGGTRLLELRDLTGMKGFAEQMQRADRLAAVGTLATGIAHEVRNPLASIRAMAQLLGESTVDLSDASEYSRRILKDSDRLERLVAGIMDFAHAGDESPQPVDLNELLRDSFDVATHRCPVEARAIGVAWNLAEDLPRCHLRPERMRQALVNLLVNALQACGEETGNQLRLSTHREVSGRSITAVACIANSGAPIPTEVREKLFEPFFTTKAEGTGLGLPIAYQIITGNGGTLELECADGEVRFWIRVPELGGRLGDQSSSGTRKG